MVLPELPLPAMLMIVGGGHGVECGSIEVKPTQLTSLSSSFRSFSIFLLSTWRKPSIRFIELTDRHFHSFFNAVFLELF